VVKIGVVAWAAADLSLALAHGLVQASRAISQAAPPIAPQLQLQRVVIGGASMEYADLFLAATLGAILAAESRNRGLAALVVAAVAMSTAAFLLVTNVIPATVPVAAALALEELRRSDHGRRLSRAFQVHANVGDLPRRHWWLVVRRAARKPGKTERPLGV
jgi:hypothetical protein